MNEFKLPSKSEVVVYQPENIEPNRPSYSISSIKFEDSWQERFSKNLDKMVEDGLATKTITEYGYIIKLESGNWVYDRKLGWYGISKGALTLMENWDNNDKTE